VNAPCPERPAAEDRLVLPTLKRVVVGRPLATNEEAHHRLRKIVALPVFASDAISSTAYATQEILLVLVPVAAMGALHDLTPIAIIVAVLLAIVTTSYRQTIAAYPSGGGAYVVSRENLGPLPSLVAGSSLLVDYVLTVAVSVSAGVAAITSAYPGLHSYTVEICLGCIVVMTLANLRGVKESGNLFAAPTYVYITILGALILVGLFQSYFGDLGRIPLDVEASERLRELVGGNPDLVRGATLYALLRAFSSGAVALSGVEAISNGVPAFAKPEAKNAATTLVWMSVILGSLFLGVSVLASRLHPVVSEEETILSVMGKHVFGDGTLPYYVLQFSTFAILILAANTAYADFPRLSSLIARDGYLPRQLATRGDRLVFSNGVVALAAAASLLVVMFGGETSALIPLYAVGVFTGFTLSQAGMVRHHQRLAHPGWRRGAVINGVGAVATGIVLVVVVGSKFTSGAWVPAVVIPLIVLVLLRIKGHYDHVTRQLQVPDGWTPQVRGHTVVVLVGSVNSVTLNAIAYASSLSPDRLVAVTVTSDEEQETRVTTAWADYGLGIELHTVHSPYRELANPILQFLDELDARHPDDIVTVIIPEFVVAHWYAHVLHNQSALVLKARLLYRPNTVVVSVPTRIGVDGRAHGVELDSSTDVTAARAEDLREPPTHAPAGVPR
jgi:amino acid transporter